MLNRIDALVKRKSRLRSAQPAMRKTLHTAGNLFSLLIALGLRIFFLTLVKFAIASRTLGAIAYRPGAELHCRAIRERQKIFHHGTNAVISFAI